jgi:hypothetical protein
MLVRLLRLLGFFTAVEPSTGTVPGEVPPAAPAAPGDGGSVGEMTATGGSQPPEPSIEGLTDAMANRVLSDTAPDDLAPDDLPYRDAKGLRDEIAQAREQYRPAAQFLEALPATHRQAYIDLAPLDRMTLADPTLGADVAMLKAQYPTLDPQDQATLKAVAEASVTNPDGAREWIAQAVEALSGDDGDGTTQQVDAFGFEADDPDRPLTAGELEKWYEQRRQAERQTAAQEQAYNQVRDEMKELGYHLGSSDPVQAGMADALLSIAQRLPDGSGIAGAHQVMLQMRQAIIDDYVAGKLGDAGRPTPTDSGAPPAAPGQGEAVGLDGMLDRMVERAANAARRP